MWTCLFRTVGLIRKCDLNELVALLSLVVFDFFCFLICTSLGKIPTFIEIEGCICKLTIARLVFFTIVALVLYGVRADLEKFRMPKQGTYCIISEHRSLILILQICNLLL